jgi:uncharacterized protein YkwD
VALLLNVAFAALPGIASAGRAVGGVEPCPGANVLPSATNAAAVDASTLCLVNRVRQAHHLRPVRFSRYLQAVGTSQVQAMVSLDYFADVRPSGTTPAALIARTPYGRHASGLITAENIGWGTGTDMTPAQMVSAWMQSVPHREIVLSREFRDGGVGALAAAPARVTDGEAGATYALELATRG